MEKRVKLANWNVAKPVSQVRRDAMLKHLGQVAADLLVLTETHDGFNPGYKNVCSSAAGRDGGLQSSPRGLPILWFEKEPPRT